MELKLEKFNLEYIPAQEAFYGLEKLWDAFVESNPPFSWGNNRNSLVTAWKLLHHLESRVANTPALKKQVKRLTNRLRGVDKELHIPIDLET